MVFEADRLPTQVFGFFSRHRPKVWYGLVLSLFCLATQAEEAAPTQASSPAKSGTSVMELSDTITGNEEMPPKSFVVPWQDANDDSILQQAFDSSLSDDVFDHIDRPEHERALRYLDQLPSEP